MMTTMKKPCNSAVQVCVHLRAVHRVPAAAGDEARLRSALEDALDLRCVLALALLPCSDGRGDPLGSLGQFEAVLMLTINHERMSQC